MLPYEELCLHSDQKKDWRQGVEILMKKAIPCFIRVFCSHSNLHTARNYMEKALRMGMLFVQAWFCSADKFAMTAWNNTLFWETKISVWNEKGVGKRICTKICQLTSDKTKRYFIATYSFFKLPISKTISVSLTGSRNWGSIVHLSSSVLIKFITFANKDSISLNHRQVIYQVLPCSLINLYAYCLYAYLV